MTGIDYFYAAHSAFAYLGSARLMAIAAEAGRQIRHKPMDLRKVMDAAGSIWFRERPKAHLAYFFGREIERWSEERDAPVLGRTPTHHHKDMTLPNCMLIAAEKAGPDSGAVDRLAHAMLQAHWRDDADLADAETLRSIAQSLALDGGRLLDAAVTAPVEAAYAANTEEAIARSVFGSPTYFVDGDMFYGQDRLELVARALKRPYRGAP